MIIIIVFLPDMEQQNRLSYYISLGTGNVQWSHMGHALPPSYPRLHSPITKSKGHIKCPCFKEQGKNGTQLPQQKLIVLYIYAYISLKQCMHNIILINNGI